MARYPLPRPIAVREPPDGQDGTETSGAFRAALRALLDWKSDPIAAFLLLRAAEAAIKAELRVTGHTMHEDREPDTPDRADV
jgi:hypothetical protein